MDLKGKRNLLPWVGLAGILVAYLSLALCQSFATRLLWGPDEPAHVIYVRSLAADFHIPTLAYSEEEDVYIPRASVSHQAHHQPLYYALAAVVWRMSSGRQQDTVRYLEYKTGRVKQFNVPGPVRVVRLFSVLLGGLTLLLVWALARTVFPKRPIVWLGATAFVGFTPMFTYINSVVNNDSLVIVIFAAVAWQWARILRFGATKKDLLVLGLIIGIGLNVKETAVGLIPLSLVVLALEPTSKGWIARFKSMVLVLLPAVGLGAWWYIRKWMVYGTPSVYPYIRPLGSLSSNEKEAIIAVIPECQFLFTFVPADVIGRVIYLDNILRVLEIVVLLSIGGIALAFAQRKRRKIDRYQAQFVLLAFLSVLVVLLGVMRGIFTIDWTMGTSGGRYFVAVLPLVMVSFAWGLRAFFYRDSWARIALTAICLVMLLMNILVIRATAIEYGTLGMSDISPPGVLDKPMPWETGVEEGL